MFDNLKKVLKLIFDTTKQIDTSGADGWQWQDGLAFIPLALQVPDAVKALPAAKDEIGQITSDNKADLDKWFADNFDIANDRVEGLIEHAESIITSAIALAHELKAAPAADAPTGGGDHPPLTPDNP